MATSGEYIWNPSTYGPGVGYPNRAKITWTASWNPATLQWTVGWSATAQGASTAGRWTTVYGSNNGCNSYITITDENGNVLQTKSIVAKMETVKNNTVLLEGSFTVGVTTTGTRSLIFSGQIYFETTGSAGISTASPQTFALDTVPLASYFTYAPSGVTVGSSGGVSTVNITRYNSSYTHDVTWTFGSHSQTLTGQGTSASFTIPASWLDAIPNSATGTCTVTLVTKSGSTQVGQATTAQFTITANVVPSYTSIVYSYRGPAYSAGITNALIAGYSNMRIAVSGAAGANGSSVARIEFIKGTSTMATVNTSAASYTYDTPLLTAAETTTFTVRITDTRGKYVQQTSQSFTIKAYAVPAFTAASVYRSNSSGTADQAGTYIKISATAAATPAENSITSLQYATKATNAGYWSADANIPAGAISGYSNTTSYDVRLTATDALGNKSYKYYTVPTQAFTMDFKVGGKGVAFGKVAETDNLVDSAWNIKSAGTIRTESEMVTPSMELIPAANAGHGGFIDFHHNGSTADYTSRIIEWTSGEITIAPKVDLQTVRVGNWTHGYGGNSQYQYSSATFSPIDTNWDISSACKLTAPVAGQYVIIARASYSNTEPMGVAISVNPSGSQYHNFAAITDKSAFQSVTTDYLYASCVANLSANDEVHLWAKFKYAASNTVRLDMWLL